MKIKSKYLEWKEVEEEITFPSYYVNGCTTFGLFDENTAVTVHQFTDWKSMSVKQVSEVVKEITKEDTAPCTREDFFTALNDVLGTVKFLEQATDEKYIAEQSAQNLCPVDSESDAINELL